MAWPRPAAFWAGLQMHGVQLNYAMPGHIFWPNGQHSDLLSNRETDI
jgi:hypothetical protein